MKLRDKVRCDIIAFWTAMVLGTLLAISIVGLLRRLGILI